MKTFAPNLLPLSLAVALAAGCAIAPRGPRASHVAEHFSGRADGLVGREVWKDEAFGRGFYFFTDPNLQMLCARHTNQSALGGGSWFVAGSAGIVVDTNLVPALAATGTAAGNVLGAAAKSTLKP